MKHSFLISILALTPAFAQSPAPQAPSFEVASIRASVLTPGQVTAGVQVDGAQVNCLLFSLRDYIRWAYSVKDYQIIAPDWMASARFDIHAKLSAKATDKQVAAMIGNLLLRRFQLRFHRETRELPVYALTVAKGGPHLKESLADSAPPDPDKVNVVANGDSSGSTVDTGNGGSFSMGSNRLEGKKFTLDALAETLSRFSDRPIVDFTGLTATYDFALEFTPDDFRTLMVRAAVQQGIPMPPEALKALDSASPDIMGSALEKLGLNLEPRKTSLEVLVIDHMEKTPSEN